MNITKETNDLVCVPHSITDSDEVEALAEEFDVAFGSGLVVGKGVVVCEPHFEEDVKTVIKQFEG